MKEENAPHVNKKITEIHKHCSLIIFNLSALNSTMKRQTNKLDIKKLNPSFCCIQKIHLNIKNRHRVRVKGQKMQMDPIIKLVYIL